MLGRPLRSIHSARLNHARLASSAPQNLIERIAQKYAVGLPPDCTVKSGDFVSISPHHIMTHDNTAAVMMKFESLGASKFYNPKQAVFTLDHDVQNKSEKNLAKYASIESFAKKNNVDFYPAGRGIGHQIMVEEGYAFPGTMAVASDSHSNMYGGIGCLGTPIVRTDAAAIWATGRTWWQVPPVVKVEFSGKLPIGSTGKDVIISLCGLLNKDEVLNHAVEFSGDISELTIDDRLTISNMTTEWGALAGVFPIDHITIAYLRDRLEKLNKKTKSESHPRLTSTRINQLESATIQSDPDASYAKIIKLDLSTVSPFIAGPNSVKVATSLNELEKQKLKINKAYLLSCTNSRLSDLKAAANVMKGKKIAPGVEFYIAAASSVVQSEAEELGDWKTLLDAGAIPLPAGCGPCIGLGVGLLKDNEVGISATNRNFKGRMGSRLAKAYLASPAVVAASAVAGYITRPMESTQQSNGEQIPLLSIHVPKSDMSSVRATSLEVEPEFINGFPKEHIGKLVFCDADNLDTDGIYPGMYTYQDDIQPKDMAKIAMKNYDSSFASIVEEGDVLVSGFNFGTGSSREQAATCLKYAGVKLILAGSLSETYKRNALNNGLLCLECPPLIQDLRNIKDSRKKATVKEDVRLKINYGVGTVQVLGGALDGRAYKIPVVGLAAQELIACGGLESWVKGRLNI